MFKHVLFRYCTHGDKRELNFINSAISPMHDWFPGAKVQVLYNGHAFDHFVEQFRKSPDIRDPDKIEVYNQRTFKNPYKFEVKKTWWKWCPLFAPDHDGPQITIDTDILWVKKPTFILEWLNSKNTDLLAVRDQFAYKKTGFGSFASQLNTNYSLINSGLVGFRKPTTALSTVLIRIANQAFDEGKPIYNPQDEQGAITTAIQVLESRGYLTTTIVDGSYIACWPYYSMREFGIHFLGCQKNAYERHYDTFREIVTVGCNENKRKQLFALRQQLR